MYIKHVKICHSFQLPPSLYNLHVLCVPLRSVILCMCVRDWNSCFCCVACIPYSITCRNNMYRFCWFCQATKVLYASVWLHIHNKEWERKMLCPRLKFFFLATSYSNYWIPLNCKPVSLSLYNINNACVPLVSVLSSYLIVWLLEQYPRIAGYFSPVYFYDCLTVTNQVKYY